MPRVSRRAVIGTAGAAVLLPYARPTLTVLGQPAELQLSGAGAPVVTWTPTQTPVVLPTIHPTAIRPPGNHFIVTLRYRISSAEYLYALQAALLMAIPAGVSSIGGTVTGIFAGSTSSVTHVTGNFTQTELGVALYTELQAIRIDADGLAGQPFFGYQSDIQPEP